MRTLSRAIAAAVFCVVACGGPSFAQIPFGTPAFGTVDSSSGPDVVDLANLNVHIQIPVLHKAGRGLDFTYDFGYDNSIWHPVTVNGVQTWTADYNYGWRGITEAQSGSLTYSATFAGPDMYGCYYHYYQNFVYHDAFGVPHTFYGVGEWDTGPVNECGPATFYGFTETEVGGYTINVYEPVGLVGLTDRNGASLSPPYNPTQASYNSAAYKDRNGNFISVNANGAFTDTLGTTALTVTGAGTPISPFTFTYTAPSNGSASYKLNYTAYTVATNFGVSGIHEAGATIVNLVSSVSLPDGTAYTITYEATPSVPSTGACTPKSGTYSANCVTGRMKEIDLPTGGKITYAYSGGNNGVFKDGSTSGLQRALSDGASWNATWTYSRMVGSGAASETTVTSPDSTPNQSILQFQGIYETQSDVYQGTAPTFTSLPISESTLQTSNLLREVQTCYNGATAPCVGTGVALPISSQSLTTILPGTPNLVSKVNSSFNSYGQLTEEDDYGFPNGTSLMRKKLITIQTVGVYQAVQKAQIQDGSGNVVAQTTMTFDQGSVTATTGTPQYSAPTVGRGNPTTISYWVSPTKSLTKTQTYFDTGNARTVTDVNSATTTFTYSNATNTCGNSFADGITEPISGLTRSFVWKCAGGVATSSTDENVQKVSTSYTDPYFWRPASTTDQLLNVTSFTYSGEQSAETSLTFNSNNSTADNLTTLDGLGRPHITQTKQSPSSTTYDSVETDYDQDGRPYLTTTLYTAAYGQACSGTCATTKTNYDALNRITSVTNPGTGTPGYTNFTYIQNDVYQTLGPAPVGENTKRKQLEYDALGRLTSVCEVTGGTTAWPSGACGQTSPATGYLTRYQYDANSNLLAVTQNAQSTTIQTRLYSFDGLKRMTSETNPESATTSYTFDSDSTCGTYNGDLVKKIDAAGNVICISYDAMHRATASTYPSGPYSSVTPSKYFVYDSATVNGTTMSYTKARVAEVYTCFSPCSSKITDIGMSYTARGETSDIYESTPHSSGYYHIPASYWPNGSLNILNNATCNSSPCLPQLTTFTYGPDGEGRPKTVTAGSGQNPVTATIYNLYSSPPQTSVTFGSGDSDVFSADANTGLMTQYKFTTGSQTVTGALTWNPDGTLGQLQITDPLNVSNNQSCVYSHDDMVRISSANCGAIWSQTFSFDPFGNINKSGNSSFGATYSPSTNRMATIGTSTPTYDANGNVTYDYLHHYTWDANNRPVTIDGTIGSTYDGLGRMVELSYSGGSYRELVYSPTGDKLAIMNGQSLVKAFVPLPGGATAVYNASGLSFYRHSDWLGSARLATTPVQTMYNDVAYAPYGESYAQSGTADFSFTGMNEDVEQNANPVTLYDFPSREYGIQGRWPSPDQSGIAAVNTNDPQSWNRYAYAMNNPLVMTDPTGLFLPGIINPAAGGPCWVCDIGIGIFDLFDLLFGLFAPPPQAAPPPANGYGSGIDASGTYNQQVPDGVDTGVPVCIGPPIECSPVGNGTNWWAIGGVAATGGAAVAEAANSSAQTSAANACEVQNLNAVNNRFGTGFTNSNVQGMFQYSNGAPPGLGTLNLNISVPLQYQSYGIYPGRYPVNWWSYVIGYGPTLHIPAGPGGLDSSQTLLFSISQFTEHLDSAFPYNPIGFLIHLFEDVFGLGGYKPCPS